ncbi:cold shock small protein YmcF [Pantoea vagans]|uniref:Cold-shock protein n=1 Tax=Pantoea vagans TaxID=470934 RepID=A0AAN1NTX4_9GAMM|nr:cold-shock protein [Pantoea vagans]AVV39228.1 cold-shock protein [Pantoea vagans]
MKITFKCLHCNGSQFRTSHFDVTRANPHGAKCIFCKSVVVQVNAARIAIQSQLRAL